MPTLRTIVDEFLVNTTTVNLQHGPSVASLSDGGFVVTWMDFSRSGGDTSDYAVRGQVFDASGSKSGGEFLVNTTTTDTQIQPSITGLTTGGFVVTWTDSSASGGDTSDYAVRGHHYRHRHARPDPDGGYIRHCRPGRPGHLQPAMAARRSRHCQRHRHHLRPDPGRRGQGHQRARQLHRRRRQGGIRDFHGHQQRRQRQRRAHRCAHHYRHRHARPDPDGGYIFHCRRRRPGHLQPAMAARRQPHCQRHRPHLRPGPGRRGQGHQRARGLHRRRRHGGERDVRPDSHRPGAASTASASPPRPRPRRRPKWCKAPRATTCWWRPSCRAPPSTPSAATTW